jgi:hypothetical protein
VSRAYRRNLRDFASPLFYLGKPGRLQAGHERFCAERPGFYPDGTASLAL